jgi:hypothetical protein
MDTYKQEFCFFIYFSSAKAKGKKTMSTYKYTQESRKQLQERRPFFGVVVCVVVV